MVRNAITLWVVVAVAAAAMVATLLLPGSTGADSHTASRSFSMDTVQQGGEFEVTISNIGATVGFGQVEETLPAGFSYKAGSTVVADANPSMSAAVSGSADGQTVQFTLIALDSFTYTVEVADDAVEGSHSFSGVLTTLGGDTDIIGASSITVTAMAVPETSPEPEPEMSPEPEAEDGPSRAFSADTAAPGDEIDVTISGLGLAAGVGQVMETLPDGFSYMDGSAAVADADPNDRAAVGGSVDGQVVTFNVVGLDSFTYTVEVAADAAGGVGAFSGSLETLAGETDIGGASDVTVEAPLVVEDFARSFSATSVRRGGEVDVTISRLGLATGVGQVMETLPTVSATRTVPQLSLTPTPAIRPLLAPVWTAKWSRSTWWEWTRLATPLKSPLTRCLVSGPFAGVLETLAGETDIGGTSSIEVQSGLAIGDAVRSFSTASVDRGRSAGVTISGLGLANGFGEVAETLPEGFSYKEDSAVVADANPGGKAAVSGTVDGQTVTFNMVGLDSFSYTVDAASDAAPGPRTFFGVLMTLAPDTEIGGDTEISIRTRRPSVSVPSEPVSQPPRFFLGESAKLEIRENSALGTPVGDPIQAQDNRKRPVTYGIAGDAPFTIDAETGQIAVGEGAELDYESARRSYTFDVTATSEGGTGSINITVVVTNVDEAGSIAVSTGTPVIGTTLTATLTDPDGGVKDVVWQWQRSRDGVTWNNISEATSDSYTARAADAGTRLRATATYADARISGLSVSSSGTAAVPVRRHRRLRPRLQRRLRLRRRLPRRRQLRLRRRRQLRLRRPRLRQCRLRLQQCRLRRRQCRLQRRQCRLQRRQCRLRSPPRRLRRARRLQRRPRRRPGLRLSHRHRHRRQLRRRPP